MQRNSPLASRTRVPFDNEGITPSALHRTSSGPRISHE